MHALHRSFMARFIVMLLLVGAPIARAQTCWTTGPAHGASGLGTPLLASAVWDPDGAGPHPPTIVVGPTRSN